MRALPTSFIIGRKENQRYQLEIEWSIGVVPSMIQHSCNLGSIFLDVCEEKTKYIHNFQKSFTFCNFLHYFVQYFFVQSQKL